MKIFDTLTCVCANVPENHTHTYDKHTFFVCIIISMCTHTRHEILFKYHHHHRCVVAAALPSTYIDKCVYVHGYIIILITKMGIIIIMVCGTSAVFSIYPFIFHTSTLGNAKNAQYHVCMNTYIMMKCAYDPRVCMSYCSNHTSYIRTHTYS